MIYLKASLLKGEPLTTPKSEIVISANAYLGIEGILEALAGGVTTSLRIDTHGKTLSYYLLEMEI